MIRLSPEGDGGLVARLESRVEQQSTLIAMMKQRLDDTLREVLTVHAASLPPAQRSALLTLSQLQEVRGLCEQHMAEAQAVSQQLAEESGARELVEERFRQLVYNHEEMIKIKDEYKSTCIQLRKELAGSSERDREEVAAVQSELQGVREGRRDAEARCVELEAGLRDLTAQHETACAEAVNYKQKVEGERGGGGCSKVCLLRVCVCMQLSGRLWRRLIASTGRGWVCGSGRQSCSHSSLQTERQRSR